MILLFSEGVMQAVSLWKNTCINIEKQNKNKWKFSAHCLSPISFCYCSPDTEGLCLTTAQMACERSTWPRWRSALEKHLADCTSSLLMESWSRSRDTMPPSSSLWKRYVSGLSKLFTAWQEWHSFPSPVRLLRGKGQLGGVMKWPHLRFRRINERAISKTYKKIPLGQAKRVLGWLSCLSVMMKPTLKKDRSGKKYISPLASCCLQWTAVYGVYEEETVFLCLIILFLGWKALAESLLGKVKNSGEYFQTHGEQWGTQLFCSSNWASSNHLWATQPVSMLFIYWYDSVCSHQ